MAGVELKTTHITLLFPFNVPAGEVHSQEKHIEFLERLNNEVHIYGITYNIRYPFPFLAGQQPIVGVGISLQDIPENIWDSTFDIEQNRMLHFDSYDLNKTVTPVDQVWYQGDYVKMSAGEDPDVFLWVDNSMNASVFNKTLRFHLTIFYRFGGVQPLSPVISSRIRR